MTIVDDYSTQVVQLGDKGSVFLNKKCAPTLRNCGYIDIINSEMGGLKVLRIPSDYYVVVHSAAGDPSKKDIKEHTASLVDRLVTQAKQIGATPLAFANVIDASRGDLPLLEIIADSMVERANYHNLAIMNGELALLGDIVTGEANVSGTMISVVRKDASIGGVQLQGEVPFHDMIIEVNGIKYAVFDPEGKAVSINSDGIGTKTKFYEMTGDHHLGLWDSAAMKVDDSAKSGARVRVISDVVEITPGMKVPAILRRIADEAVTIGKATRSLYPLQIEEVGDRIRSYNGKAPGFNVSGSTVCTIDEERLKNPLKPSPGEYLIAIRGKPNPRSNGITSKRAIMEQLGKQWCEAESMSEWKDTSMGKLFLKYLAAPSVLLYPLFRELIEKEVATSFYHPSGGAYAGKVARPLAKHGLFARIANLFQPDWRESTIVGYSFAPAEKAYGQWPMGTDGFITVRADDRDEALATIRQHGLEGRVVGPLENATEGRTGVELVGIKASNGENVYFSGK